MLTICCLLSSLVASAQTEVNDAAHRMNQLQRPASDVAGLRLVHDYVGTDAARVGLVENAAGQLTVIARLHTRAGDRIDVADVIDDEPHQRAHIRVVSQRHRLFAVAYRQLSRPADPSPCACTSPGGVRGEQWFRIRADGSVYRILNIDSGIGSARWDEATRRAVVTEARGPVRCPAGCDPAPAIQIVYTRTYELRGDRLEQLTETSERIYTG